MVISIMKQELPQEVNLTIFEIDEKGFPAGVNQNQASLKLAPCEIGRLCCGTLFQE